jgi:hypothetical protein
MSAADVQRFLFWLTEQLPDSRASGAVIVLFVLGALVLGLWPKPSLKRRVDRLDRRLRDLERRARRR